MKKYKLINLLLVVGLLTSCGQSVVEIDSESNRQTTSINSNLQYFPTSAKGVIGDDVAITRGQVAKILALTYLSKDEIDNIEPTMIFKDLSKDSWYYNYANAVANLSIIKGDGINFRGEENLTIKEAQFIIDNLSGGVGVKLNVNENNENKPISYGLWIELYTDLLENIKGEMTVKDKFNIEEKEPIILGTNTFNNAIGEKHTVTNDGVLGTSGQNLDAFLDKRIRILEKDGELITVLRVIEETPTIKNAYIVNYDVNNITIFVSGITRIFKVNGGTEQNLTNNLCDITIYDGNAKALSIYTDSVSDIVLSYDANKIEFKESETMKIGDEFKVYSNIDNNLKVMRTNQVPLGENVGKFIVNNDEVIGFIIDKEDLPNKLRVGISTTGFDSLIHSEIKITSDTNFIIKSKNETKNYGKGEVITINEANFDENFGGNRIFFENDENGKFEIQSISRNWSNNEKPKYRGTMEISKVDGGLILTNEVDMEEYLYAVVPSEMPTLYGVEAAKIQALTARSYAFNQYYSNRLTGYGVNVDDSVNFQVYNNTPENSVSIEAVNSTKGMCITANGNVLNTYFFSTSGGGTANSGDVWNGNGGVTPTEFTGKSQVNTDKYGDLSIEENARAFFMDKELDAYEKNAKWFRWNVTMDKEEISTSVNKLIESRYNHNKNNILTKQADGSYVSEPINSVGLVTDLKVVKRGAYGNIIELEIIGTEKTVKVITEYNIRVLLKPYQYISDKSAIVLETNNGVVNNYTLLPSSFFTMDIGYDENNNLNTVKFYGGGNGHGVGMSQTGAYEMLNAGKTVEEVIKHYYTGVEIEKKI